MPPKRLAVGITTFDDTRTAIMTAQSVRLSSGVPADDLEIIIADNKPQKELADFCRRASLRYLPVKEPVGTSAPREAIFKYAHAPVVCVMDSHVLLEPGALAKLIAYAEAHPESRDLWHGAMLYDGLGDPICSMKPEWGDDLMFGKWDEPRKLAADAAPFEIPMHGMGLVACRKEAWIAAPQGLRGFGGCEGMIHERFRQVGRKVLCLPFLRWWHLFRDQTTPANYPNTYEDRCRNYLIYSLMLTLPLETIREKFEPRIGSELFSRCLEAAHKVTKSDRPIPSLARAAVSYGKDLIRHKLTGSKLASPAEQESRLAACNVCEHRVDEVCGLCRCPVTERASWHEKDCPDPKGSRWPKSVKAKAKEQCTQTLCEIIWNKGHGLDPGSTAGPWGMFVGQHETPLTKEEFFECEREAKRLIADGWPTTTTTSTPTTKPRLDHATCPHTQFVSTVRINRGPNETIAHVRVRCRCGAVVTFPDQDNATEGTLRLALR